MGEAKRRKDHDPNFGKSRRHVLDIRPDQSSDMFANLPPGVTSDDYLNYLDQNWDILAASAYDSYLKEGRGVLLMDWDLSLDSYLSLLSPELRTLNSLDNCIIHRQVNCPVLYLGERGPILAAIGGWFNSDWERLIARYDPERMIVLALCWNFQPNRPGNMMVRTLALANRKSPAQLYVDNGDRLQEFSFWAGTGQVIPSSGNQVIRGFRAAIETSAEFRLGLGTCFKQGVQQHGKGAVFALPQRGGFQVMFVPSQDLAEALGADEQSRPFQQLQAIVERCNPVHEVAAVAIDSDITKTSTFSYYSFLLSV